MFFQILVYLLVAKEFDGVHPHVALSATRGKASPSLKEIFQPCFMAVLKASFQPCLLAGFKEQMFL